MSITDRIKRSWNAFMGREPPSYNYGYSTTYRPDTKTLSRGVDRTIVAAIYNRIAMDVAAIDVRHVKVDDNENFKEKYTDSYLSQALSREANVDQTGRELIQDLTLSMFDEGCVGLVPTDAEGDPRRDGTYDPKTLRTGKILEWYPKHVKVRVYNENTGKKEDLTLPKRAVAIIRNPLYDVMNQPNSTLQRLIRKLTLLDTIDEQTSVGKLDLIIQLPYVIKNDTRREQAERRRKDIEAQLAGSKYGIAYTDGTERITQLNRSLDNNLMGQIEYLTSMLYSQLGITQEIMNGTANEETMLNYYSRTIEPIISAIALEMKRKFLTKTARTQGQTIMYFRDPFTLVPSEKLAELADKFTRNEILTSNEFRGIIGYKPSSDPKADQLINSNLNHSKEELGNTVENTVPPAQEVNPSVQPSENGENSQNGVEQTAEDEAEYTKRVFASLTDEQKDAVYYVIGQILGDEQETEGR